MEAGTVFKIANNVAIVGWILMVVAPRWVGTRWVVHKGILPLLLSGLYLTLFALSLGSVQGNFGSLAGVKSLFANDWILLAGWVHYLAFDMFVGSWALRDSWKRDVPHWVMVPVLFATLMLGPVGYLLYRGLGLYWTESTDPGNSTTSKDP